MLAAVQKQVWSSVTHALFQARAWREYARTFDGVPTRTGVDQRWVETHLRMTRRECLDCAWEAARAAKRMQA